MNFFKTDKTMRASIFGLVLMMFTTQGFTKEMHETGEVNNTRPDQRIEQLERELKSSPDDVELLKPLGIAYYTMAVDNQKEYAPVAHDYLSRAYQFNKKDVDVMCALGSATCMMAKTTFNPMKKMSYSNKGLALMDKAVARQPDNVSLRMMRGITLSRLPSFFKRKEMAISDFLKIETLLGSSGKSTKKELKKVYGHLSQLYQETDQPEKTRIYNEKSNRL